MFAPCQRSICTSDIVIADDEIVEEVETIALILQSPHLDFIRLDPSSATINITDPSDSKTYCIPGIYILTNDIPGFRSRGYTRE